MEKIVVILIPTANNPFTMYYSYTCKAGIIYTTDEKDAKQFSTTSDAACLAETLQYYTGNGHIENIIKL